jgi:tetratricopeptide (TPR) repeat protein
MIAALLLAAGMSIASPNAGIALGDSAFTQLRYAEARGHYLTELQSAPRSAAVLWRMARLMNVAAGTATGEEKHDQYREAERYARSCVAADSSVAEGHTWLAVSLGNLAMFEGSKAKVRLANEIKGELDRALALNRNDDVAYSILGSFYRALGNVSWIERQLAAVFLGSLPSGGYAEAEQALKKAIALAPGGLRHRYELGLLYADWGKDDEARKTLQECLRLTPLLASDRADQERIREKLRDLD